MPKSKNKRRKKNNGLAAVLIVLVVCAGLVLGGIFFYNGQLKPAASESEQITFTVSQGESLNRVIKNLEDQGVIRSGWAAKISVKLAKLTNIKAGTYILDPSWEVREIFEVLNDSHGAVVNDTRLTFIEGDWAKHIAEKIGETTRCSKDEMLALWNDESYVRSLMSDYPFLTEEIFNADSRILLEGYLFPETYNFFVDADADQITRKILDQTLKVYNEFADQFAQSQLSVHQLFTLASSVQYEAAKPSDMQLVAGVFYNRLAAGMKLQSSVTVCYAIDKEKDDDWMACEVNPDFDSPYNTYRVEGLPPGPILNPGRDAIQAVLQPQASDYLYFMADVKGDGTVYYAKTYAEHQANVRKYLK